MRGDTLERGRRRGEAALRRPRRGRRRLRRRRPTTLEREGVAEVHRLVRGAARRASARSAASSCRGVTSHRAAELVERIWARDADRSGPVATRTQLARLAGRAAARCASASAELERVRRVGWPAQFDAVVLLGMGGSTPRARGAPDARSSATVVPRPRHDPSAAIRARWRDARPRAARSSSSSSKSGTTLETRCHLDFFWEQAGGRGESFAAITDPGSELEPVARERGFRASSPASRRSAAATRRSPPSGSSRRRSWASTSSACSDAWRRWSRLAASTTATPGSSSARAARATGWKDGRDKVRSAPTHGRLRPLGRAADRGVDRQAGEAASSRCPWTSRGRPGPAGAGGARHRARTSSGRSSTAGSSPPRSPARSSASTRSTSRTCRRRRTRRTRCSPATSRRSADGGLASRSSSRPPRRGLRLHPGVHRPGARSRSSNRSSTARARDRLRRHARPRPAVPAFDGPAAQGRAADRALFVQVVDDPGDELAIPDRSFGFGQLIRAQADGDFASLQERGTPIVRVRLEDRLHAARDGRSRPHGRQHDEAAARTTATSSRPTRRSVESTATPLEELASQLEPRRARVWTDDPRRRDRPSTAVQELLGLLDEGDVIVDGGNSNFRDSQRRCAAAQREGIGFVDAGVSGGIWGLANGYCLMVGGDDDAVAPSSLRSRRSRPTTATRTSARRARATS